MFPKHISKQTNETNNMPSACTFQNLKHKKWHLHITTANEILKSFNYLKSLLSRSAIDIYGISEQEQRRANNVIQFWLKMDAGVAKNALKYFLKPF